VRRKAVSLDLAEETEDDVVLQLLKLPNVVSWLSTGCTVLDLSLSGKLPGGFPAGRVSQIYGQTSTGKSVMVQEPLGSAQRQGGKAFFADSEFSLDIDRAMAIHGISVDPNRWNYFCPKSAEQLFDVYIESILNGRDSFPESEIKVLKKNGIYDLLPDGPLPQHGPPCAVAVDSLSALSDEAEIDHKLADPMARATKAKVLSRAFRKYTYPVSRKNLALIMVDQVRFKPDALGNPETTSGGQAPGFYSSVRLRLSEAGGREDKAERWIKDTRGRIIGERFGFFVKKNKVAMPFEKGYYRYLFGYGVDDIGTSLEWLRPMGESDPANELKKKFWTGSHFSLGGKKVNGIDNAIKMVEGEGFEVELTKAVQEVWDFTHPKLDRKARIRLEKEEPCTE